MIYGNKFLNYGINPDDMFRIIAADVGTIEAIHLESGNFSIKEFFNNAFNKIKEVFKKIINTLKRLVGSAIDKVIDLGSKALNAIKKKAGKDNQVKKEAVLLSEFTFTLSDIDNSIINRTRNITNDSMNCCSNILYQINKMIKTYEVTVNNNGTSKNSGDEQTFNEWKEKVLKTFESEYIPAVDKNSNEINEFIHDLSENKINTTIVVNGNDDFNELSRQIREQQEYLKKMKEITKHSLSENEKVFKDINDHQKFVDNSLNKDSNDGLALFIQKPVNLGLKTINGNIQLTKALIDMCSNALRNSAMSYMKVCTELNNGNIVNDRMYDDILNYNKAGDYTN